MEECRACNACNKTEKDAGGEVSEAATGYEGSLAKKEPKANAAVPADGQGYYTYADYCSWDDDRRWELIDGVAYLMGAPARRHQEIIGELYFQIANYLKGKHCKVYLSPFDVRFNPDGADDTVLQPDVLVVCDHGKLTKAGCDGAPDMVIEVLSPSSVYQDRFRKLILYEKYGVREYWIVEPDAGLLTVYTLKDGRYDFEVFGSTAVVPVGIFEDCSIDLTEVFAQS